MIKQNLHCHTSFDDGKNSPEEMVVAAVGAQLNSLGISAHVPVDGDECCMKRGDEPAFKTEMSRLRDKWREKIELYTGLEYDLAAERRFDGYDYVIGSVHWLDGAPVDLDRKTLMAAADRLGGADAAAERYFDCCARLADIPEVDIVGHFDLLTKFDEQGGALFDENGSRYKDAAYAAMERLNAAGKIFEINTGAISRGYRTSPYPSAALLRHLHDIGGRIVISSDAHSAEAICCGFDMCAELARGCGFGEIWRFDGKGFRPEAL